MVPPDQTTRINYDGRRFRPVDSPEDTSSGRYTQRDDTLWAEFSGPHVRIGRLVGTCGPDGTIEAAYCFLTEDGRSIAGTLVSTPTMLADGRIALTERWHRMDGTTGVSNLEEIAQ
jgi:hypothetical protein